MGCATTDVIWRFYGRLCDSQMDIAISLRPPRLPVVCTGFAVGCAIACELWGLCHVCCIGRHFWGIDRLSGLQTSQDLIRRPALFYGYICVCVLVSLSPW